MSKTNRMYKIFMTVMVTIIAGLLLACGVIAVKNSMRVKMSIPANPNFLIEIYIQKDGSETQNLVFKNFGEVQIQNGISGLNANTLVASDNFITLYGGDFSIIIKNYTTTMGINVSVTSTATIEGGGDGVPAEITAVTSSAVKYSGSGDAAEVKFNVANKAVYPQQTLLEITFAELTTLDVSFSTENTSTGNVETTINYGSAYSQTLTAQDGYVFDENITVTGVEEGGYSWTPNGQTGVFTITDWSKVTGPISINVNAVQNTYTITFNANGGNFEDSSTTYSEAVTVGTNYSLPTAPTKDGYSFLGWAESSSATEATWTAEEQTANKVTTWYAVWVQVYSVTVNINIIYTTGVQTTVWEFEIYLNDSVPFIVTKSVSMSSNIVSYKIDEASGILEGDVQLAVSQSGALATVTLTFNSFVNVTSDIVIDVRIESAHTGGSE